MQHFSSSIVSTWNWWWGVAVVLSPEVRTEPPARPRGTPSPELAAWKPQPLDSGAWQQRSPNFETFKEPKNRFQGTNSARLCSLAGRYDNTIPITHRLFKNSSTGKEGEKDGAVAATADCVDDRFTFSSTYFMTSLQKNYRRYLSVIIKKSKYILLLLYLSLSFDFPVCSLNSWITVQSSVEGRNR
jgi:hypothetical protein